MFGPSGSEGKGFFFEKKNQKTFIRLGLFCLFLGTKTDKSLFASFSSEKEESFFSLAS